MKTLILSILMAATLASAGDLILCTSSILTADQTNSVEQGLNNGDLYKEPAGSVNRIENWATYEKVGVTWQICVYNDAWLLNFMAPTNIPDKARMNQWIASLGIGQSPKRLDVLRNETNTVMNVLLAEGYVVVRTNGVVE